MRVPPQSQIHFHRARWYGLSTSTNSVTVNIPERRPTRFRIGFPILSYRSSGGSRTRVKDKTIAFAQIPIVDGGLSVFFPIQTLQTNYRQPKLLILLHCLYCLYCLR